MTTDIVPYAATARSTSHGQYHCAGHRQHQQTSRKSKTCFKDYPVAIKSLADFGPMPEAVEDGATFDENAYKKALHYAKVLGTAMPGRRLRPGGRRP
jgi:hypothetical protein